MGKVLDVAIGEEDCQTAIGTFLNGRKIVPSREFTLTTHSQNFLMAYRIIDLLRELFSVVVTNQLSAKNTKLVASDSGAITFAGLPKDPPASIKIEEIDSQAGAFTERRHAHYNSLQVATRYASICLSG